MRIKMLAEQKTRERILSEAAGLVQHKGFTSTSISDILSASGITKGTLYYHFASKEELGLAILERDRDDFLVFLDSVLADGTPLEALERLFSAALEKHRQAKFVGGCLWGNTALEMSDTDPAYSQIVEQVFNDWIDRIQQVIRAGQKAGEIRSDILAVNLARIVVSTIEGGIMLSRLSKQEAPFKNCLKTLSLMLRK